MSGQKERLGGEGSIQWEESKSETNLKSFDWTDPPVPISVAIVVVLALAAEYTLFYGSMVLIIGLVFVGINTTRAKKHDNIDMAPNYLPYFGHLVNVFRRWRDFYDSETEAFLKLGKGKHFCAALPLRRTYVFVNDPYTVDLLFRLRFGDAEKGEEMNVNFEPMFGNGIFASDGSIWKKHRAIASKMFTIRSLRDYMFEVFNETTDVFLNKIEELRHEPIDIYNMFNRLTLEAFTQVAFGVALGCVKAAPLELKFATSFDRSFQILTMRFIDLAWKIKRFLKIGLEKELIGHVENVNGFITSVIEDRKKQLNSKTELAHRYDLLSLFLKEDPNISDEELRDVTVNFIIAGRDTTAQLLSWFFYKLSQHPKIEEKILKEINENCPDDKITYEQVSKMEYLEKALLETLRLHPSVPHLVRYAKTDIHLPDGHTIRKNEGIVIPTYAMGRLPWIWENPLEFNPDRFEGDPYSPSKYPAFNIPPRLCLGKHVALLEAKIGVIQFLKKYKFVPLPNQEITYVVAPTNQMKNGFKVNIIPRTT